jgi:hypothetical protein
MQEKVNVVKVDWVDSDGFDGWHHPEEEFEVSKCVTVGILAKESKDAIRIDQSQSKSKVDNTITIPRCAIKKIKRIKL